jgi:hypothetical protein
MPSVAWATTCVFVVKPVAPALKKITQIDFLAVIQ